jgi:hypothetical protein
LRASRRIDPARVLSHFGAKRLTELPAERFTVAVAMIDNPPAELRKPAASRDSRTRTGP